MLFAMNIAGLWLKLASFSASVASKLAPVVEIALPQFKQHPAVLVVKKVVALPLVSSSGPLPEKLANSVCRT
jgi:hypothetical protein